MKWSSKNPPQYVWEGDEWFNEKDQILMKADIENEEWYTVIGDELEKVISFPPKTKIMGNVK